MVTIWFINLLDIKKDFKKYTGQGVIKFGKNLFYEAIFCTQNISFIFDKRFDEK